VLSSSPGCAVSHCGGDDGVVAVTIGAPGGSCDGTDYCADGGCGADDCADADGCAGALALIATMMAVTAVAMSLMTPLTAAVVVALMIALTAVATALMTALAVDAMTVVAPLMTAMTVVAALIATLMTALTIKRIDMMEGHSAGIALLLQRSFSPLSLKMATRSAVCCQGFARFKVGRWHSMHHIRPRRCMKTN
jgi:hypothetical protein